MVAGVRPGTSSSKSRSTKRSNAAVTPRGTVYADPGREDLHQSPAVACVLLHDILIGGLGDVADAEGHSLS